MAEKKDPMEGIKPTPNLEDQLKKLQAENAALKEAAITVGGSKKDHVKCRALMSWTCEMGGLNNRRAYKFKAQDPKKAGFDVVNSKEHPEGQIYFIPDPKNKEGKTYLGDIEKFLNPEMPILQVIP